MATTPRRGNARNDNFNFSGMGDESASDGENDLFEEDLLK